jgi:Domain of unknown function (DUF6438)
MSTIVATLLRLRQRAVITLILQFDVLASMNRKPFAISLIIASICFCCCSSKESTLPPEIIALPELKNDIPAKYKYLFQLGDSDNTIETISAAFPYESISLRRTECYGSCPVYEIKLYRTGKAELHAEKNLPKLGKFVGEIYPLTYGRLCYLIEKINFNNFKATYVARWTDDSTCVVTIDSKDGRKSVSDYGQQGPIELWGLQQAIDAVKNEIHWKPK